MNAIRFRPVPRAAPLLLLAALTLGGPPTAAAHEGHEPLPSTGAAVHGDELLLAPAAVQALGLRLEKVTLGDVVRRLHVNARVELPAGQQARVATFAAGKVAEVLARPGDTVRAGQILARVESLELESLQSELLETAARLELLRRLVAQQQDLVRRGTIPGRELLGTEAELRRDAAQHEIARRKLTGLGLDVADIDRVLETGQTVASLAVVSPIAGRIEHVGVRPGQLVDSSERLFDIVDPSRVYLVGDVVETDAHLIRTGQPVRAGFAGLDDGLAGTIDHVRLHLDEQRRTLAVVIPVENAAGTLRAGMFGRISIEVGSLRQQIICPAEALIDSHGRNWVLRRTGEGRFKRQPVTIAAQTRGSVVIESGVFPGQEVVVRPTRVLASMFDALPAGAAASATRTRAAAGSPGVAASSSDATAEVTAARGVVELPTGRQAHAASLIEGRVARLLVEPGDEVRAGQIVAELHSQRLRDLQLELLTARSRLAWTAQAIEQLEPLARSGLAARQELWEREAERRALESQIAGLRRKLSLVGLADADIEALAATREAEAGTAEPTLRAAVVDVVPVRAPIGGRVARIGVVPGELVHAHDHVVEIHDAATVWVRAFVLERDAPRVEEGQTAVVQFPADPDLQRNGRIVRTGPGLVSPQRVLPVWIEVTNPDGFLKVGMLARTVIHTVPPAGELVDRDDR